MLLKIKKKCIYFDKIKHSLFVRKRASLTRVPVILDNMFHEEARDAASSTIDSPLVTQRAVAGWRSLKTNAKLFGRLMSSLLLWPLSAEFRETVVSDAGD